MAKKQAGAGQPSLFSARVVQPLPTGARPLFLPDLLAEAARNKQIDEARRDRAHVAFAKWAADLGAGVLHAQNEIQVEQDFAKVLLAALGYATSADVETGRPWTMQPKWHQPGAGTADVALGHFRLDPDGRLVGEPVAVVEVEKAGKDLDRKESSGRSPVQQAWDYLNGSDSARWAIVSNYDEFRLYSRQRSSRHVYRAALVDLADPAAFAEFYAVLHADALLGGGGVAITADSLLKDTGDRQEAVSDKLYQHYAECRAALIGEFRARGADLDGAIRSAQRLLDRVLFIAFAEDRGLLPNPRTLADAANTRAPGITPWHAFQGLFRAIDRGDEYHRVPRYNGNLFKFDPLLDDPAVELDPARWPPAFRSLGDFDFRNEVTVDVLGRIFERSITDIEQIKAAGGPALEAAAADRRRPGRRKVQGVYYTEAAIVDYLVGAALNPLWEARRAELAAEFGPEAVDPPPAGLSRRMLGWLDGLAVCDPACGSGAFLNAAYDWFEDARCGLLDDLAAAEPDAPECAGDRDDWCARSAPIILRNNLYGVDLSPESVEIAQLSLWVRTARRSQALTDLSANIVCGNSVVDDPAVDPAHAFDWPARVPGVLARGGFDAVVGNPPYVRQEHLGPIKPHLERAYRTYHGMADLYVYFFERGMGLLRPGGRLAFVVTNKWMKAGYGEPLRRFLAEQAWVESVVDFGHAKEFFKDADVFPCFLVARRPTEAPPPTTTRVCVIRREEVHLKDLKAKVTKEGIEVARDRLGAGAWMLEPGAVAELLAKIRERGIPLAEYAGTKPYFGIKTGSNEAFLIDTPTRDALVTADPRAAEIIKPYVRGQDIKRWLPAWDNLWIILLKSSVDADWPWTSAGTDDEAEEIFHRSYPALYARMKDREGELRARADQGAHWWELRKCGYYNIFERSNIFYQDLSYHSRFCLSRSTLFAEATCFALPSSDCWLLAVLNSPLMWSWFWRNTIHGKDEVLRLKTIYTQSTPIILPPESLRSEAEFTVERLLEITKVQSSTRRDLLDWLKVQYDIAEPGTKLRAPIGLDSDAFVAEVQKGRGKAKGLTSAALRGLREEYARVIEPARALAAEAAGLERRLNDLVNEAYGLTPEEVRLMWDTAPPRMPIARPAEGAGGQIGVPGHPADREIV